MLWTWPRLKQGIAPAAAVEILDRGLDRLQRSLTVPEPPVLLRYTASITPDLARLPIVGLRLDVTDANAFTMQNPVNVQAGSFVSVTIGNFTAGALGVLTWGANYQLLDGAWVQPATNQSTTILFWARSPTNLVELSRSPSPVGGGGGGEANTGSNANTGGGVGVFDAKVGVDLRFRGIKSTSAAIAVALNAGTKEIELTGSAGAGVGGSGVDTLDFGAFPGTDLAAKAIVGQAGIVAGSVPVASIRPLASADHSREEHFLEELEISTHSIIAGTGFTIRGVNRAKNHMIYGIWNVQWFWI